MGNGTIFAHDAAETPFGTSPDEAAIALWFALVYSCYFTFYISGSVLVYDALGQELTDNYHRRGQLFALKSFLGMLGALCGIGVQLVVYGMFPTDTLTAATVTTAVLVAYGIFSYVLLLWGVAEKQLSVKEVPAIPLTPALMRMMRNPPYRWYLLMKVPMTFLGQLPYQLVLLFYQNNMRMENVSSHYLYTLALALMGAFLSIPVQLKLSQALGRKQTLTGFLAVLSAVFLLATFVPFHTAPTAIFPVGICLGVCITLPNIIPDAILGDIIDYDELRTGTRSEAMYTTVETNIQQGIELLLTAAQLCMALAGYTSLGGCECGCGVSCKALGYDHARWVCPGSVGYTCADPDDNIGADLLFGPEPEQAPCSVQSDGVFWVTAIFMFFIPGLAGLLAIPAARRAIISNEQLDAIVSGVAALKANPQAEVPDPIMGGTVRRASNAPMAVLTDHFTTAEWARYAQDGAAAGMRRLRRYLGGRLAVWAVLFCGFVAADVAAAVLASRAASEALLQARVHVSVVTDVLASRASGPPRPPLPPLPLPTLPPHVTT